MCPPAAPHTHSHAYLTQKLIVMGIALALVLNTFVAFTLPHVEPDLWGHVQYGRDFLTRGLPSTTTYSFTAVGHRWINHENLSEIAFAAVVDTWGIQALAILRTMLGLAVAATLAWRAGRIERADNPVAKFSWPVAGVTTLLLSLALTSYWQLRPQVLSCVLFSLLVLMLSRHTHRLKRDAWLIPLLLIVWTNTHGAFLAGVGIFAAYFALRSTEVLIRERSRAFTTIGQMAALIVLGIVVTLINPYGWNLHRWLLESLTIPRPEIVEWHPMRFSSEPFLAFVLLTAGTIVGLAFTRRRWDWTHVVSLGLTWWQALSHQRHLPFFTIMVCAWMPVHWASVWSRFIAWRNANVEDSTSPFVLMGAATCVAGLNVVLMLSVVNRFGAVNVDKSEYPVAAMQFIADQQLSGKMVVTYNWAQYAIGCFGPHRDGAPQITVGFDGRFRTCYPLDLIDQHFDFILGNHPLMPRHRDASSPPAVPGALLQRDQPDLVLISRKQPHSSMVMEQAAAAWCLLYQDELAQIWGRRSAYDVVGQPDYLAPPARLIGDAPQSGVVPWPAMPIYEQPPQLAKQGS